MSNNNNKKFERVKRFGRTIRKNRSDIVSLITLVLILAVFINQNTISTKYEHSLQSLQHYDISVDLLVVKMDFSEFTIPIEGSGTPTILFNNDSTVRRAEYYFENTELNMVNGTIAQEEWRVIYIRVFIPTKAYRHFNGIESTWTIDDDQQGTIRREYFVESTNRYNYYEAVTDLSTNLWFGAHNSIQIETVLS